MVSESQEQFLRFLIRNADGRWKTWRQCSPGMKCSVIIISFLTGRIIWNSVTPAQVQNTAQKFVSAQEFDGRNASEGRGKVTWPSLKLICIPRQFGGDSQCPAPPAQTANSPWQRRQGVRYGIPALPRHRLLPRSNMWRRSPQITGCASPDSITGYVIEDRIASAHAFHGFSSPKVPCRIP